MHPEIGWLICCLKHDLQHDAHGTHCIQNQLYASDALILNDETMWRFKIAFNLFYMALDRQNAGTSSKVLTH